jgi:post-segregation antitoxin (ccd killing protein)
MATRKVRAATVAVQGPIVEAVDERSVNVSTATTAPKSAAAASVSLPCAATE